ncbi:TonB-dependent receptor plug domain-containing protein [Bacteroides sp.]
MKKYLTFITYLFFLLSSKAQTPDSISSFSHSHIQELQEIEVTAQKHKKSVTGLLSGKIELQLKELQNLPGFLGSTDILKIMQLMPGVQTSGELNSGIYIRGGDPGHNQILLNNAPLYNPMHLLGFFSTFNSDHISQTSLQKSYIAPQYGGRLSGVIAIECPNDIAKQASISGNIGIINSQLTLTLPTGNKSSLYLSARATYLNLLLSAFEKESDELKPRYNFQDYNLTYVLNPSSKTKLLFNAYYGSDKLAIKENNYQVNGGVQWKNIVASLQWEQAFKKGNHLKQTAYLSYYNNLINVKQMNALIQLPSDIADLGYKAHYNFKFINCKWSLGGDYAYHQLNPQYPQIDQLFGTHKTSPLQKQYTHETGIYLSGFATLTERLSTDIGLRYSNLLQRTSTDGSYGGLEPRISVEYTLDTNQKLFVSYELQRQYINQVSVSGIGFPTDFWVSASKDIAPQRSHSFTVGYFQSLSEDRYEFSTEIYYKRLSNQLEFDGELLDMVNRVYIMEEHLLTGKGTNYGIEFMFKKNRGKLNGWLSYTLGRAQRSFPGINNGQTFAAKHDRRHDFSAVANYHLNDCWDFSAVFVYATGNAFTMPKALYLIGENAVNEYGPHNGARMPAYHRLDLSVNYWFKKEKNRERGLNFSFYNAYARQNPIFLNIKIKPDKENENITIRPKGQKLYTLVPSISYKFKF